MSRLGCNAKDECTGQTTGNDSFHATTLKDIVSAFNAKKKNWFCQSRYQII
jgi:hypothetical protein